MTKSLRNVLVIGGTGHFGARICRRLLDEPGIRLFVSSRSESSANQFASELLQIAPQALISGVVLDHLSESFETDLALLQPNIVVHTAGPFQGQDYKVAEASAACGSHYIDLADGRGFVEEFPRSLNEIAEEAKVLLVTGASTLPGLSSAVVQNVTDGWQSVNKLNICIAPAQQTPRGLSTIRAVLSYCGKPFDVLNDGRWQRRYGWQSFKFQRFPGLGPRLSAVCDVPDLALFPQHIPTLHSVIFRAALESKLEHLTLWLFAGLTRLGIVKDWARFASSLRTLSWLSQRMGGADGGMRVEIEGLDQSGKPRCCEWDLVAGGNHGPEIPVSPALVLVRKLVRGELSLTGAHSCFGLISLQDFANEVDHLDISWSSESSAVES